MKGYRLDVNLLIALAWPNHPQHARAHAWFAKERAKGWRTCMVNGFSLAASGGRRAAGGILV
jgi:hypothetical protein